MSQVKEELQRRIEATQVLIDQHETAILALDGEGIISLRANVRALEKLKQRFEDQLALEAEAR